jgi:intein-encoded DNA endonuclease-like protein
LGGPSSNPLGGGSAGIPAAVIKPPPKAEEQLKPITEGFKNEYIQKMCQSQEMMEEYDKYDGKRIKMRNKSIEILETLNKDEIDIKRLQQIAFSGIPETIKGLRAVVWRIVLGELTNKTGDWKKTLE